MAYEEFMEMAATEAVKRRGGETPLYVEFSGDINRDEIVVFPYPVSCLCPALHSGNKNPGYVFSVNVKANGSIEKATGFWQYPSGDKKYGDISLKDYHAQEVFIKDMAETAQKIILHRGAEETFKSYMKSSRAAAHKTEYNDIHEQAQSTQHADTGKTYIDNKIRELQTQRQIRNRGLNVPNKDDPEYARKVMIRVRAAQARRPVK